MWLAIWGIFAAFILVFVLWTMMVLFQQKKAWSAFARRRKLKYDPGTFMGSPVITGEIEGCPFSLYTGVQQTDDIRGQRYVTILEFQLGQGMPTGAAIATSDYAGFIDGLVFNQSYDPDLTEWKKEYVVRARSVQNLQAYLNKERLQILHLLFAMKNAAVLFFFDELEAVLRIETSDPLRTEAHLEKIVRRLTEAVSKLAPGKQEKEQFKALLAQERQQFSSPVTAPPPAVSAVENEEELDLSEYGLDSDDDEEEEIIIIKKKKKPAKKKAADGVDKVKKSQPPKRAK